MAQQFSLHAGLKKFGDEAKILVTKELTQIHDMGTYTPMDPDKMTKDQKRQAMRSLMLITEKQNGNIKSRAVADGSSQRRRPGYKKEDSASPTVSTDGVFITGDIKAWEERIIICFDIPCTFLHTDCKEGDTFMLL